jgi:hypothetical protein
MDERPPSDHADHAEEFSHRTAAFFADTTGYGNDSRRNGPMTPGMWQF